MSPRFGASHSPSGPRRPASRASVRALGIVLVLAAHAGLAVMMRDHRQVATLHALLIFGVGAWIACLSARPERAVYIGAYIAGAEVLWRMNRAGVFWEFGKLATVAIFAMAALRVSATARWRLLPLTYFALLLPSAWFTLNGFSGPAAMGELSSNLSGPLALAVGCIFLSQLNLTAATLRGIAFACIAPVTGIAALAALSTYGAADVIFGKGSSFSASAGFGPNQVSAALGLGALAALLRVMDHRAQLWLRLGWLGLATVLAAQSALTLSRGGLYTALGAAALGAVCLARSGRARASLVGVAVAVAVIGSAVLPRLNAFSGDALAARFEDRDPTGRDALAGQDVDVWLRHIVLGVGPGGSAAYHTRSIATHTEYTRLLAEHGLLGLAALALLGYMAFWAVRAAPNHESRALVVTLIAWSALFMLHSAMRLVAPSFVFALAFACLPPPSRRWRPAAAPLADVADSDLAVGQRGRRA